MSFNNSMITDLTMHKAALNDDWDSVSRMFEQEPNLMTKQLSHSEETPLIIAVGTNRSHSFVEKLVERIVEVAPDKLFEASYGGNNPLHYAAKVGNTRAARLLVEKNSSMTRVPNPYGDTPIKLAAWHGNKETLEYLLTVTPDLGHGEEGTTPYTGVTGGDLITLIIMAGFYDLALKIINLYPNIVLEDDSYGKTALQVLATKPEIFPSAARIKEIRDTKVNDNLSNQLVKLICKIVIDKADHNIAMKILGPAIDTAVTYGTHELIEECIVTYPSIIWSHFGGFNLFLAAIRQRQERVYNLVYQMSAHKVLAAREYNSSEQENALHMAAKLAPPHRLNVVRSAALQMQRELQWFQEVEKVVCPSYREMFNIHLKTPRMLFTDEHKDLLKEGQKWMKDTAKSCSVVAALIVTITFAAAITFPGGNKDNGKPVFLNDGGNKDNWKPVFLNDGAIRDERAFILFMISNGFALLSSSTSLLMFLGILTSRFAEIDFLHTLPKRLAIGLVSLFLAIAATMIAFGEIFLLMIPEKVTLIYIIPALVFAMIISIPVGLFVFLHLPLLADIVESTCGPDMFRKQSSRIIY